MIIGVSVLITPIRSVPYPYHHNLLHLTSPNIGVSCILAHPGHTESRLTVVKQVLPIMQHQYLVLLVAIVVVRWGIVYADLSAVLQDVRPDAATPYWVYLRLEARVDVHWFSIHSEDFVLTHHPCCIIHQQLHTHLGTCSTADGDGPSICGSFVELVACDPCEPTPISPNIHRTGSQMVVGILAHNLDLHYTVTRLYQVRRSLGTAKWEEKEKKISGHKNYNPIHTCTSECETEVQK